jgi:hypothetical protein
MVNNIPGGESRRRWAKRPILLVGTALIAVAAGAGIALAATSGSSPSSLAATDSAGSFSAGSTASSNVSGGLPAAWQLHPGCRRVITPVREGVLCPRFGLGSVLHGSFVLPKAGGGTVTVEIQNGKVTSVSQSSITLRSTDGYTETYVVTGSTIVDAQRDGIGSVKVGDQVWVIATVNGNTVTAVRVRDVSQIEAGLSSLRPGYANGAPAPAAASSGGLAGG